MREYRSLIFGIVLASACIIGLVCWQIVGRGDGMGERNQQASISNGGQDDSRQQSPPEEQDVSQHDKQSEEDSVTAQARRQMVEQQLAARDITDKRVLDAMRRVRRHFFAPESSRASAYADGPLPIGHGQTISQPYIVALMTQLAQPEESDIALDVGTGSGYQAAVLSLLCKKVFSIEIVEPLAKEARQRLEKLGYENVTVRHGNGYGGWPEKAPFDLIIVAAAPEEIPEALIEQLKPGGRLVIPVGTYIQNLMIVEKKPDGSLTKRKVAPVAFVPMTGDTTGDMTGDTAGDTQGQE